MVTDGKENDVFSILFSMVALINHLLTYLRTENNTNRCYCTYLLHFV